MPAHEKSQVLASLTLLTAKMYLWQATVDSQIRLHVETLAQSDHDHQHVGKGSLCVVDSPECLICMRVMWVPSASEPNLR